MISAAEARDFVSRMARVRVYSAAVGMEDQVLTEGNAMSYIDAPSIELLQDDGKLKSWSTRLRIAEIEPPVARTENDFASAVMRARLRRHWTQEYLAEQVTQKTGVLIHQTGITRIEQGKRRIRLDEAIALAELLDITLSLGGES